jgi:hypothetical protein
MKIRVGFSTTNGLLSKTIRWFTGNADVSHCYIRIYDEYLQVPLILHADWIGVIFEHAELFDKNNLVIEEYEIDDARLRVGLRKNLRLLKKSYDWKDIISWALALKFHRWFKRKLKDPISDPIKIICVNLIMRVLNDSALTDLAVGSLHPQTFCQWFRDNYKICNWKKLDIQLEK